MPATNKVVATELRGLSRDELNHKVGELKEELFTLRFSAATGQLQSNARLRAVRKDIARIYTVLQERALGIIEDPDAGTEADETTETDAETAAPARTKKK